MTYSTMSHVHSSPARQRGATLLEVLVAVLVLSVGLLGVAALQASALRNSQSSYERSQATVLSYSLFDIMRADRDNATSYNTDGWLCDAPTGASLREVQLADWMDNLETNLGDAANTCVRIANCGTTNDCAVEIRWDDSRGTGGDTAQVILTETQL